VTSIPNTVPLQLPRAICSVRNEVGGNNGSWNSTIAVWLLRPDIFHFPTIVLRREFIIPLRFQTETFDGRSARCASFASARLSKFHLLRRCTGIRRLIPPSVQVYQTWVDVTSWRPSTSGGCMSSLLRRFSRFPCTHLTFYYFKQPSLWLSSGFVSPVHFVCATGIWPKAQEIPVDLVLYLILEAYVEKYPSTRSILKGSGCNQDGAIVSDSYSSLLTRITGSCVFGTRGTTRAFSSVVLFIDSPIHPFLER